MRFRIITSVPRLDSTPYYRAQYFRWWWPFWRDACFLPEVFGSCWVSSRAVARQQIREAMHYFTRKNRIEYISAGEQEELFK